MSMERVLYWTPRIASLLFVAFVSVFALDVFGEYRGMELAIALFMHLVPSLVLLAATLVAWRYDLFGAAAFIGFAFWYIWWAGFDRPWNWYASIAAPAALVGFLYALHWFLARGKNASTEKNI